MIENIPSLIKWSGSKRLLAKELLILAPREYNIYREPFLGGGALLYYFNKGNAIVSDVYKPLIDLWVLIRDDPNLVIGTYEQHWSNTSSDYYYMIRDRFNKSPNPLDLLYLTRTCVNGLIRFNSKGEFNTSFHHNRKGMHPLTFANGVNKWSAKVQSVEFNCCDYNDILNDCNKDDFLFLDPPYTGSDNMYIETLDFNKFVNFLTELNNKECKWLLTFNAEHIEASLPDTLYKTKHPLHGINSSFRRIKNTTFKVKEMVYMNYSE